MSQYDDTDYGDEYLDDDDADEEDFYDDGDSEPPADGPMCSVPGCTRKAKHEVIFYDFYDHNGHVYFKQDTTCPYICGRHAVENEAQAHGVREPRSSIGYPYTKQHGGQAFTIYRPLYALD